MYSVIGKCPVCGREMIVTRLYCPHCATTLEGSFNLGLFYRLSPEQLRFVELFIRCEGKLNRVAEELGLSYPTVRSRLNEVIRALGYEVREEPGLTPERRKAILEELARGEITADEAVRLLKGEKAASTAAR